MKVVGHIGATRSSDNGAPPHDLEADVVPGLAGNFAAELTRHDRCVFRIEADVAEFTAEELREFELLVARIRREKSKVQLTLVSGGTE